MSFYKTLSVFILTLLIFSSNVFSMEDKNDLLFREESDHSSISIPIKEDIDEATPLTKNKKSHWAHWGLTRWVYGIGEYIQRSLCLEFIQRNLYPCCCDSPDCCFDTRDPERKYIITEERTLLEIERGQEARVYASSDCAYIDSLDDIEGGDCIRDCCLIPCCPLATLIHLCCLPCACCENSKTQTKKTRRPFAPIRTYNIPETGTGTGQIIHNSDNEKRLLAQAFEHRRQQEIAAEQERQRKQQEKQFRDNMNREAQRWNDHKRNGYWS